MKKATIFIILLSISLPNNWLRGLKNPNGPTGELTLSFNDPSLNASSLDWGASLPVTNSATIHYYNMNETFQVDFHIPLYKLFMKKGPNKKNPVKKVRKRRSKGF